MQRFLSLYGDFDSFQASYNGLASRFLTPIGLERRKTNWGADLPHWKLSQRPQVSYCFVWLWLMA